MKKIILKTTLHRSNPQVVREFELDDSKNVRTLLEAAMLCHGWKKETRSGLRKGIREFSPRQALEEVFLNSPGDEPFYVFVPRKNDSRRYYDGFGQNDAEWLFRLDVRFEEEEIIKPVDPKLLRFRGLNPYPDCPSMGICNQMMQQMEAQGTSRFGWETLRVDEFYVRKEHVNLQLKHLVAAGKNTISVRKDSGLLLQRILDEETAERLKEQIRKNHLDIRVTGRKADIVDSLAAYYDTPGFWRSVLYKMSLFEYRYFQSLCLEGKKAGRARLSMFPVLQQYCLLGTASGTYKLPLQLLDQYEIFLSEEGDENLILEKEMRSAVLTSCRLYGVFTKDACRRVYAAMFPEKQKPAESGRDVFDILWDYYRDKEEETDPDRERWGYLDADTVFYHRGINREIAERFLEIQKSNDADYYLPNGKEALQIAEWGLGFSDYSYRKLERILNLLRGRRRFFFTGVQVGDRIYELYHLGFGDENVINVLTNELYGNLNKNEILKLSDVLGEIRDEVRICTLRGHTVSEIYGKHHRRSR